MDAGVEATALSMIVYVSDSRIPSQLAAAELATIVAHAKRKNSVLGVTGSLVFTGDHFVQLLEAPPETLQALMASIRRDPRHTNIAVCSDNRIPTRQFVKWSLAYAGPSQYIARQVTAAIATDVPGTSGPSVRRLSRLMQEFAQQGKGNFV